ncbi:MAG: M4 family metallopeptidase, partial [Pseudomonadota bacterium]
MNLLKKILLMLFVSMSMVLADTPPQRPASGIEVLPLYHSLANAIPSQMATPDPRAQSIAAKLQEIDTRLAQHSATSSLGAPRRVQKHTSKNSVTQKRTSQTHQAGQKIQRVTTYPEDTYVRLTKSGSVRAFKKTNGEPLFKSRRSAQQTSAEFLNKHRTLLGLHDPASELKLSRVEQDQLNHRHLRYEQRYKGLRVFGTQVITQIDHRGDLISLNGSYIPTPRKLETTPVISEAEAKVLIADRYSRYSQSLSTPGELMVYKPTDRPARLAWRIPVRGGLTDVRVKFIDAHNGEILASIDQVHTMNVAGSGQDLFGVNQQLNVWQENGSFFLTDTSKPMYDGSSNPPQPNTTRGGIIIMDLANQNEQTGNASLVSSNNANGGWLPDGVSAAVNLSATYEYFRQVHNRNSLNGQGGTINALVRVQSNLNNAFFIGSTQTIFFGDADEWAGTIDFVAHELTHGVVDNSAKLVYQDQSGALNESYADVFGELVEAHATGQTDWKLGTRLDMPLRDMANPGSLSIAGVRPYPSKMSEFISPNDPFLDNFSGRDNGGVHFNSSIPNHCFYLLAVGLPNAIGMDDAARIFYRTLTTKLGPSSQFIDARIGSIQSAEELFGANSPQAQRTAEAFDAVEIFDATPNPTPGPVDEIAGPDNTIFTYFDNNVGAYFLGRVDNVLGDTLPGIQLTANPVARQRPSVSGDGARAVYVDANQDVCIIQTNSPGTEECLGLTGQVASVAIAPDGRTYGFVFLNNQGVSENSITVIDAATGQSQAFTLLSPAPDATTNIEVVRADAMDFTADNRYLVYDAFNSIRFLDGSTLGLWSIYAVDLISGATLTVIPPVGSLDIAFPSIAQTSDTHFVFDVFNQVTGQNLVV